MMVAYRERTLDDPSPVVVQKLMYLLQTAGEPLRLSYTRGPYGPYADNLRRTLRDMAGHSIDGFADDSATVAQAEPLSVCADAGMAAALELAQHPETGARVRVVLELIEGFESPYGLELLASVHWVAAEDPAAREQPDAAARMIRQWSTRTSGLVTDDHVLAAWERLRSMGWLTGEPAGAKAGAAHV